MVAIDTRRCTGCGACIAACPLGIFTPTPDGATTHAERAAGCLGCGACVVQCSTEAVQLAKYPAALCPPLSISPSAPTLTAALLRARRTTRRFRPASLPRTLLEEVLTLAATAPAGLPPTIVEVLVVTDPLLLRQCAPLAFSRLRQLQRLLRIPGLSGLMRAILGPARLTEFEQRLLPMFGQAEARFHADGLDMITWHAPALLVFHSPAGLCAQENAHIALAYATVAAETLGLGTCVNGIIEYLLNTSPLRRTYGIPAGHTVWGVLLIGYPEASTPQRSLPRAFATVRWREEAADGNPPTP
jgi:ferredoxin